MDFPPGFAPIRKALIFMVSALLAALKITTRARDVEAPVAGAAS